jgi:PAS domain S-box-containing protein
VPTDPPRAFLAGPTVLRPLRRAQVGIAALVVIASAVLVIAALLAEDEYTKSVRASTDALLASVARGQALTLSTFLRERVADAGLLAADARLRRLTAARTPAMLAEATADVVPQLEAVRRAYGYHNVQVVDAAGRTLLQLVHDETAMADVADAARRAMDERAPAFVALHEDRDGQLEYGVIVPVLAAAADSAPVLGALYLSLRAQDRLLTELLATARVGRTMRTVLLYQHGDSVHHYGPRAPGDTMADRGIDTPVPWGETIYVAARAFWMGGEGPVSGMDDAGRTVRAHIAPVADTPWLLAATLERAETEARIRLARLLGGMTVGLLVLALVLAGRTAVLQRQRELATVRARLGDRAVRILATSLDGYVELDDAGRILEANAALAAMTGYTIDELRQRALGDVKVVAGPEEVEATLARIRAGDGGTHASRWRRKDGTIVDVEVSARHLRDGDHGRIVAFLRDVTELRRGQALVTETLAAARDALEQRVAERTAELAAANARLVITDRRLSAMLDLSQRAAGLEEPALLQLCIDEACRLTDSQVGYLHLISDDGARIEFNTWSSSTPALCHTDHEAHYPVQRAGVWADAVRTRRPVLHNDFAAASIRSTYPEGHVPLTRHLAVPLVEEGRVRLLMGVGNKVAPYDDTDAQELEFIARDVWAIVQRRRTEAALAVAKEAAEDANRAKSSFLAVMSHEIRTPLNGVIGMSEVLAQSPLPPREAEAVRTIQGSARTLMTLIDDVLDFSKIEAGRLELETVDTDLYELADGIIASLGAVAATKGVDLAVFIAPDLPTVVRTDATRLRQIVFNLVGNAVKFSGGRTDRRGAVALRLTRAAGAPLRLRIDVRDNGVGISEEAQARLFSSFTQAETSTTRRFGGTGLGLAICRRLTDLLGGRIGVDSVPGLGATFTVELPLEPAAAQPAPDLPDVSGVTCVLIDAAHPLVGVADLVAYLAHAGAQVSTVASREAARAVADASGGPVVVIEHVADMRGQAVAADPDDRLRHLLLAPGYRKRPRVVAPSVVVLDLPSVRQRSLLRSVAIASGRASPEVFHEASELPVVEAGVVAPSVEQARAAGRLILVAEDDEVNQRVLLRQLELLGYAAEVAPDGRAALRAWERGGHALLITDLHMPEMDGYQLAAAVRAAEPPGQRRPIIALTANALRGEAARAREMGVDEYLTKPIQLRELKRAIEERLGVAPAPTGEGTATATADEAAGVLPLDVGILAQYVGDDPVILREFLSEFLRSARVHLETLRQAVAAGDLPAVQRAAHTLKSTARTAGALPLGARLAALETAARDGNASAAASAYAAVATAWAQVAPRLDAQLTASG